MVYSLRAAGYYVLEKLSPFRGTKLVATRHFFLGKVFLWALVHVLL